MKEARQRIVTFEHGKSRGWGDIRLEIRAYRYIVLICCRQAVLVISRAGFVYGM